MAAKRSKSISKELGKASLKDPRHTRRLEKMADGFMARPGASLPQAMGSEANLEGAYRFLNNDEVRASDILAPHTEATAQRVVKAGGAYCIGDTSEFRFGGTGREGLGPLQNGGRGFLGHVALAVARDGTRLPLGVLGFLPIVRSDEPKPKPTKGKSHQAQSESRKWLKVAEAAEEALDGRAPLIHLLDREADIYALLALLVQASRRFIVRVAQNRSVVEQDQTHLLFDQLELAEEMLTREVPLSARPKKTKQHPRRGRRVAKLTLARKTLVLCRPDDADKSLPEALQLNFVHVFEKNPPEGETAVDWKLVTTEPIETSEQVEAVVDGYRTRWVIEEFFKVLKSGCRIQRTQLESFDAIMRLLAILLPISAQLLALRTLARSKGSALAEGVLTRFQLEALRIMSKVPVPARPSAAQALRAVASLGGYIKGNGDPGWEVLHRGMYDLTRYAEMLEALENRR